MAFAVAHAAKTMDKQTRLDRTLNWIKNNKVTSGVMLVAIGIVATSQLVNSLSSLIQSGKAILSSTKDNGADSDRTHSVEIADSEESNPFGKVALKFGEDGIGPGFFTDPRHVAIDRQGWLYVCEFQNRGRVQRFDSQGRFQSQWFAVPQTEDKDFIVSDIAIDEHGVLYMAQAGGVFRYATDTGTPLGKVAEPQLSLGSADSVQPNPTGGVVIWWEGSDDHTYLVLLNSQGEIRRTVTDPITSHLNRDEKVTWPHLAVDGMGNIYVINTFGHAVLKLSPDGEFMNRFGSEGRAPGQLSSTSAIAVNGKGDVYVGDWSRIQRFDGNGTYLGSVKVESTVRGLAFNDAGDLYALLLHDVIKINIDK